MRIFCAATLLIGLASHCSAGLVTDTSAFQTPTKVIDFSQFSGDYTFTAGPEQVGGLVGEDVVYTAGTSDAVLGDGGGIPNNEYAFGQNGYWDVGRNGFAATDAFTDPVIFRFNDGPVASVGGLLNYFFDGGSNGPTDPVSILALAADNSVLESYIISDVAPIGPQFFENSGQFRGIQRAANDIYGFQIQGSFVAIDDLAFSRVAAVPEPSSFALVGLTVAGLSVYRRRHGRTIE